MGWGPSCTTLVSVAIDIHPTLLAATLIVILVTTPRRCPHPSGRGHSATSLATAELGLKPSIAPGDTLDGHIRHSEILKGGGEDSATNLHIYFFPLKIIPGINWPSPT